MTDNSKTDQVDHDREEWQLLDELDQLNIKLNSAVSLADVLSDVGDSWQYGRSTFEDAMRAFVNHLESCVTQVNECSSKLFKNYRARHKIPETTHAVFWPDNTKTEIVLERAKKLASTIKKTTAKKKRKSNGK